MSSNDRSRPLAFLWCALLFTTCSTARAQDTQPPSPVVCPANITVTETGSPVSRWSVVPSTDQRSFERISVYNGMPGEQEFDLAPDDQKEKGAKITQTWDLKAYRTMNIFIRCRYHNTSVVLLQDLPRALTVCKLQFILDSKGKIAGESSMECR
jgi:hypothetical protein